jgi:hypothetical protein
VVAPAVADKPKKSKGRPGPKPDPTRVREAVTNIRSSDAWKGWAKRLAEFDAESRRSDANISEAIDRALVLYAREMGFPEVAPKR